MAAMIYCSLTSIPALTALALFTLIIQPRSIWRWWLPAGLAIVLTLPELISKLSIAVTRTEATASMILNPFFDAIAEMYRLWGGSALPIWMALFALAVLLSLRSHRRTALALLIWSLLPTVLYVTNPVIGFFNVRYAWWVMVGIALLLSVGLAALPDRSERRRRRLRAFDAAPDSARPVSDSPAAARHRLRLAPAEGTGGRRTADRPKLSLR